MRQKLCYLQYDSLSAAKDLGNLIEHKQNVRQFAGFLLSAIRHFGR
jgi:hypothetical protein